jgi:CMP-N,N'-diacetyllegionaminic acid synthase
MRMLAVIPARGGSKGVPGKNLRPIAGKPLIAWSIEQALACPAITRTLVSTDDTAIAQVARDFGAQVPFLRPAELAQDTSATEPVMLHALDAYAAEGEAPFDAIVLLQPTSPLRHPGTLAAAVQTFVSSGVASLLGVCENHHFFWRRPERPEALYDFRRRPRRQDIAPADRWYRENGSIYITRTDAFRTHRNRLVEPIAMFAMREEESWEIDSLADFAVVESLMKHSLES